MEQDLSAYTSSMKREVLIKCYVAHYVGGKCVEQWEYDDKLGFLQQIGIIPSMG